MVAVVGALLLASGCGQRGPLYLPTDPAAAQRATLPEAVLPDRLRGDRPARSSNVDGAAPAPAVPPAGVGAPTGGLQ